MVAAYHLIWTAYGWWLPNDPRGSNSREIRCASIEGLGQLHFGRKRIQPAGQVIEAFYQAARGLLKHSLLKFSDDEMRTIADSIADTIPYVAENPNKARRPPQVWEFVVPYDGWLPGIGAKPQA
ncbi:MAG: hypothetical protein WD069_22340 [Planctomycetales bacterium]